MILVKSISLAHQHGASPEDNSKILIILSFKIIFTYVYDYIALLIIN